MFLIIFCMCFFVFFMRYHGISWGFMDLHGSSCVFMGFHGSSWVFMGFHGSSWGFMDLHGSSWVFMGLHGSSWDLHGSSWVIMGFHVIFLIVFCVFDFFGKKEMASTSYISSCRIPNSTRHFPHENCRYYGVPTS